MSPAARVKGIFQLYHRGQRVYVQSARPSIQSSELGPPPPLLQESVAPPFGSKGGGRHIHSEEGVGGTNSDDWAYTLVFYSWYTLISRI